VAAAAAKKTRRKAKPRRHPATKKLGKMTRKSTMGGRKRAQIKMGRPRKKVLLREVAEAEVAEAVEEAAVCSNIKYSK